MKHLATALRNKLENAVKAARDIAEEAARTSLEQLGVPLKDKPSYLDDAQAALRNRLRAHGRQLGDVRSPDGSQEIRHLIVETAYEHWHRMLFTRFLAENNLLMHTDGVPVSLEDCEELAHDENALDGWELAGRYASRMLPQIFRKDSPVLQLHLAPEHQKQLEKLLAGLDNEIFRASDSLGWVYQFWQAKKKDEVNRSEVKIGADELPAVTQLFTESYIVNFLLDNSLGAWWAARRLSDRDLKETETEEELRTKVSLPGVPLEYLRFVRREDGRWTPAAGTFDGWPEYLSELKVLDPCCGSGHFLVAAFMMLVPMRMELENLSAQNAVDAVLRDNLHGLEIDQRCVELAAFALALAAWRYPHTVGYRTLPEVQVACSGLSVRAAKEEWKQLALGKHNLRIALDWLYDEFKDALVLGSLLNPVGTSSSKLVRWEELSESLETALSQEQNDEQREVGVVAQGMSKAASLMAGTYHWVVTNVPYLALGKQNETLREFCEQYYPAAKNDLATAFLDRCLDYCLANGTVSIVLPQNWLFLTSYKKFREKLLKSDTWHLIARLGSGAFETITGEVVKAILICLSRDNARVESQGLFKKTGPTTIIHGIDVSEYRTTSEKAAGLLTAEIRTIEQAKQLENPDARIVLEQSENTNLLQLYSDSYWGLGSGDYPRFGRFFWENILPDKDWIFQLSTVLTTTHYGAREHILYWQRGRGEIVNSPGAFVRGTQVWGSTGVHVSQMRELPVTIYSGECWDSNSVPIIPKNPEHLPAIWCFCSSLEYNEAVRRIDQKLNVTNATLIKIPFDLDHWITAAKEKYPNGLPKPYSDDPTQWVFHGHPCGSVVWDQQMKWTAHGPLRTDESVLQVVVARLLGYRWPPEIDEEMELSEEARAWAKRCDDLLPYADDDGIVCIPPVRGEKSAAERLHALITAAYGDDWSPAILSKLLAEAGCAGKTLEAWLRDKFFEQHFKLFQHRPFIWHIWDGIKDGFGALVNYHKLTRQNLETLTYTYLGDWMKRQEDDIKKGVDGAQTKLMAAQKLRQELEKILEGEAPYDIFIRWKPIEQQPIGWEPDLNDGVRLNIRPFMQAGILRKNPNINWNKDRGKDVESSPWYHLFKGDRINDHHLSLSEKKQTRLKKKG